MRNALITVAIMAFALICHSAYARDVIVTNLLSDKTVVVNELYRSGVVSDIPATKCVIPPNSQKTWVIRIPAMDDYLYSLKLYVTSDESGKTNLQSICKAYTDKLTADWFNLMPNEYHCDEDQTYLASPNFDPENEAFTIVVTPAGVVTD